MEIEKKEKSFFIKINKNKENDKNDEFFEIFVNVDGSQVEMNSINTNILSY